MDKFFGGKDPFDHPFFTQPFGGLVGGRSPFDDPFFNRPFPFEDHSRSRNQITIEELNGDDDGHNDFSQNNKPGKELSLRNSNEYPTGIQSFSFQKVEYGGPDGVYYTSSIGRRTGGDGVVLMEMNEEDKTVGESLHTVSKGIQDKGHSVTSRQCSDGRVDTLQTLHNLNEDELTGFEENWKTNADKDLPGWNNGFDLLENAGFNNMWEDFANWSGLGGWSLPPALEYFGNDHGAETSGESQGPPHGKSRKVVPID